jgi:hypothetical protein
MSHDIPSSVGDAPKAAPSAGLALLPAPYRILPASVPFRVPGFEGQSRATDFVLAPGPIDCAAWFGRFVDRVSRAVGTSWLPVCRMSDGEFTLLFGPQPPSLRYPPARRLRMRLRQVAGIVRRRLTGLRAHTAKGVSSGAMSYAEIRALAPVMAREYADVARAGILGLHLSYGKTPFQEQFFPPISRWLADQAVTLTPDNYVPFYFVYALLRGPAFPQLVSGRRVLVVHSADGGKREAIATAIRAAGAREVDWLSISSSRAFADRLDLGTLPARPDLCLLGAGIGKARLFGQLMPLAVPCIDAGFSFEAWADPDKQWDRPYMTPDSRLDVSRVRFLSEADKADLVAAVEAGGRPAG